jgi:hypothetical protein
VPWLNTTYDPVSTLFQSSSSKPSSPKLSKQGTSGGKGANSDAGSETLAGSYNGASFQKGTWLCLPPEAFNSSSQRNGSDPCVVSFIERNLSWWDLEWRENGVMVRDAFYRLDSFVFVENDVKRTCL